MGKLRVQEVATLLGVSNDTVRRLVDDGEVRGTRENNRILIDGKSLVEYMKRSSAADERLTHGIRTSSIRNQMSGIVTDIVQDTVMTRVEMLCGPFRIVSLISTEAAKDMNLEVGTLALANAKATNVSVALP